VANDDGPWFENNLFRFKIAAWKYGYICYIRSAAESPIELIWDKCVLVDEDKQSHPMAYPLWWNISEHAGTPRIIVSPHSDYTFFMAPAFLAPRNVLISRDAMFPPKKMAMKNGPVVQQFLLFLKYKNEELYYLVEVSISINEN
jgi:hypothetical protein